MPQALTLPESTSSFSSCEIHGATRDAISRAFGTLAAIHPWILQNLHQALLDSFSFCVIRLHLLAVLFLRSSIVDGPSNLFFPPRDSCCAFLHLCACNALVRNTSRLNSSSASHSTARLSKVKYATWLITCIRTGYTCIALRSRLWRASRRKYRELP